MIDLIESLTDLQFIFICIGIFISGLFFILYKMAQWSESKVLMLMNGIINMVTIQNEHKEKMEKK